MNNIGKDWISLIKFYRSCSKKDQMTRTENRLLLASSIFQPQYLRVLIGPSS